MAAFPSPGYAYVGYIEITKVFNHVLFVIF